MAVNKLVVVCGIVAGMLAWFATKRDIFTVKNEMFVVREASEVYQLISDLCRPNEELVVDIQVDMIGGLTGAAVWTLVPSSLGDLRGTLVTEEFSLHCLRVTCGFIQHKAAVSHEELFQKLKEDLESP